MIQCDHLLNEEAEVIKGVERTNNGLVGAFKWRAAEVKDE